eukprot:m.192884 g.192884  ORF g.192884 m.192884 type:complete len:610 (+) comp14867_c1_seq4:177-2006(+)
MHRLAAMKEAAQRRAEQRQSQPAMTAMTAPSASPTLSTPRSCSPQSKGEGKGSIVTSSVAVKDLSDTSTAQLPVTEQQAHAHAFDSYRGALGAAHSVSSPTAPSQLESDISALIAQSQRVNASATKALQPQQEKQDGSLQRHLDFIDQLLQDKAELSAKCEELSGQVLTLISKHEAKVKALQDRHKAELAKAKQRSGKTEQLRRAKWEKEKTKAIKEATIRGLEPEIQRMLQAHKEQLAAKDAKHQEQLSALTSNQSALRDRLRQELQTELESKHALHVATEIDKTRDFYRSKIEEDEEQHQKQRRHWQGLLDEADRHHRELLDSERAKWKQELEEAWAKVQAVQRQQESKLRETIHSLKEQHTEELRLLRTQLQLEKSSWQEMFMRKQSLELTQRSAEMKEELRKQRDEELEGVIDRLERDTSEAQEKLESAYNEKVAGMQRSFEASQARWDRERERLSTGLAELQEQFAESQSQLASTTEELKETRANLQSLTAIKSRFEADEATIRGQVQRELDTVQAECDKKVLDLEHKQAQLVESHEAQQQRLKLQHESALVSLKQQVAAALQGKDGLIQQLQQQLEAANERCAKLEDAFVKQKRKGPNTTSRS